MLDALIVGGGPVGLYLGCLLSLRGLSVQVLETRREISAHSRAVGLHPLALELFERVGLAQAAVSAGVRVPGGVLRGPGGVLGELELSTVSVQYPFVLTLPQRDTETLLQARFAELAPGALRRGVRVTQISQTAQGVCVTATQTNESQDEETCHFQARFVIGADGRRSTVRQLSQIPFEGRTYPDAYLMGDFPDTTAYGPRAAIYLLPGGVVESFPLPGQVRRWVAHTGALRPDATPAELTHLLRERTGLHIPAGECRMLSAFEARRHAAAAMHSGRVLLIGDAAHEVSPIGGQGMNLGWLDAAALAPLLELALTSHQLDSRPFGQFSRERLAAARRAARQAEINMFLGRPATPGTLRLREKTLGAVLRSRAAPKLAEVFTMRWAALAN